MARATTPARVEPLEAEELLPGQRGVRAAAARAAAGPGVAATGSCCARSRRPTRSAGARCSTPGRASTARARSTCGGCGRSRAATRSRRCDWSSRRPLGRRPGGRSGAARAARAVGRRRRCRSRAAALVHAGRTGARAARGAAMRCRAPQRGPARCARMAALEVPAVSAVLEDLLSEGAVRERDGVFAASAAPRSRWTIRWPGAWPRRVRDDGLVAARAGCPGRRGGMDSRDGRPGSRTAWRPRASSCACARASTSTRMRSRPRAAPSSRPASGTAPSRSRSYATRSAPAASTRRRSWSTSTHSRITRRVGDEHVLRSR